MATIIIVDDHPMVLHGVRTVLNEEPSLTIVGEATTGAEALALLELVQPNIVLLDLVLPDGNSIGWLQKIEQIAPVTRVVIFSMHANDSYVRAALSAEAAGFVLKDAPASELLYAIREALAGRRYLSPAITDRAVEVFLQHGETAAPTQNLEDMLTSRERQIFQLVAMGETNAAIAERLYISPRTVEAHRANLMRKLGLKSHAELVRHAIATGVLPNTTG